MVSQDTSLVIMSCPRFSGSNIYHVFSGDGKSLSHEELAQLRISVRKLAADLELLDLNADNLEIH